MLSRNGVKAAQQTKIKDACVAVNIIKYNFIWLLPHLWRVGQEPESQQHQKPDHHLEWPNVIKSYFLNSCIQIPYRQVLKISLPLDLQVFYISCTIPASIFS